MLNIFFVQLFFTLLIFSSKLLSPGVNAGCPNSTTTTTHAPTTEAEEELMAEQAAAVAAGASVLAAAAAAPPPLPMMAPQGLPQPGSVSAGGGVLPATAFAVR